MPAAAWSSLEITKLIVGVITPLLLVGLGFLVNRALKRIEDTAWTSRKLVEKRLEVYENMAPLLNDIYCSVRRVGDFQKLDPPRAVELKRKVDKLYHVNKFLFEEPFAQKYDAYIGALFKTYNDFGEHAKLRVSMEDQRDERKTAWKEQWVEYFVTDETPTPDAVVEGLYNALMKELAEEVGVGARRPQPRRGGASPRRRNRAPA